MGFQVSIDRDLCIACRVAPDLCPEVFILGDDTGKNTLVEKYLVGKSADIATGVVPDELYDCVRKATDACPVQAIAIQRK